MKNCTVILLRPKPNLMSLLMLPIGLLIELFTGGKSIHVAFLLDGTVDEETYTHDFTRTPLAQWLNSMSKEKVIYIMEPISLFDDKRVENLRLLNKEQEKIKYSVGAAMFTVLDRVPLLNRINWGGKGQACSVYVCKALQTLGVIKPNIDPLKVSPNELVSLIKRSGFYKLEKKYEKTI